MPATPTKDQPLKAGTKATKVESQQESDNALNETIRDAGPKGLATVDPARKIEAHGATRARSGYDVADIGTGFEDFTQDDVAVPFLAILQKGSPQVEEDNPKRLEGAKASMLMNTVSQQLYDGKAGVTVIPVHRTRTFIEWIPKDDGGGLVNVFQPDDPAVLGVLKKAGRKFGKLKIGDNNDLVETFNVFALLVHPDRHTERVIISFASSQIGGYKKWMTMAQSIQIPAPDDPTRMVVPPMFSHLYRLTTFFFQKKENTWYKWAAAFANGDAEKSRLAETDPLFEQAKQFRALILSGAAQVNYESAVQEHGDAEEAQYEM